MNHTHTLLLALLLTACGQMAPSNQHQAALPFEREMDVRSEFLRLAANDSWAKWPDLLQEDPADDGQPCERVSERFRERAIARLAEAPAVALDAREYERLTGDAPGAIDGTLYLLRGFSTTNSTARVKVTGDFVTVHSDGLNGLFNLRRYPCVTALRRAPIDVYTAAADDL